LGLAVGASALKEIFDESFYNESEGGLLGGLGMLFRNPSRLYVYPHLNLETGQITTADAFPIAPHLKHLYAYLLENRSIQPVRNYNRALLALRRTEIVELIRKGDPAWESMVPTGVLDIIKRQHLFGWRGAQPAK
jgi:hypothetical protein